MTQDDAKRAKMTMSEAAPSQGAGLVRTYLVFTDLPVHVEFQAAPMPVMQVGTTIHFDLVLRDPKDSRRRREVTGPYRVSAVRLNYRTKPAGLSQYLELAPAPQ